MSLLVMGISHHSAPMDVLEKVATIDTEEALPVLGAGDAVGEVLLLSTCNRIEVYTEVSRFHAAVESLTAVLAKHAGHGDDRPRVEWAFGKAKLGGGAALASWSGGSPRATLAASDEAMAWREP